MNDVYLKSAAASLSTKLQKRIKEKRCCFIIKEPINCKIKLYIR